MNNKKEQFNILQINAIYKASVPVLKIKFDLESIIPNEIKGYKYTYNGYCSLEIIWYRYIDTIKE